MKHLLLCPEYRPAPIPPGGIGTYVAHIARLMAEAGEEVHVVGMRWAGAPIAREEQLGGRLVIHRVSPDEPMRVRGRSRTTARAELSGLHEGRQRAQRFALQSAALIERLVSTEEIDVIEAQEYDAPLHIYQLRRALGLGPPRLPPCIIQLHSPSEFIFRHNEWDMGSRDFQMRKRSEDFSIGTADALLCPSRYLSRQAEAHYGLPDGRITVLPLPIGETAEQHRPLASWEAGVICYVGRLEPRKGVIEWVEAAVAVAEDHPEARFEFVGADLPYTNGRTVKQHLLARIPRRLRHRFTFHGSRPREDVMAILGRSCAAAVPSRWENFPNTCIEAMCTGTPVIATREGGMAEMIEDGQSGWLAARADPAGLAEALRRALATPPRRRAEMGACASRRIRAMCDNARTLTAQLAFRREVAERGACRSLALPPTLPWARQRLDHVRPAVRPKEERRGCGIVVTCRGDGLDRALAHVSAQQEPPTAVVVVVEAGADLSASAPCARRDGWVVLEVEGVGRGIAAMRNAGARHLLRNNPSLGSLLFLDEHDRVGHRLIQLAARVLDRTPEVAVVTPWTRELPWCTVVASAPPAFPYQVLADDSASASVIRTSALREIGFFDEKLPSGYDRWDAVSRIMARGWVAVVLPELLAERWGHADGMVDVGPARAELRASMLRKLSTVVERDATELVLLLDSGAGDGFSATNGVPLTPLRVLRMPLSQKARVIVKGVRDPVQATRWLRWHLSRETRNTKAAKPHGLGEHGGHRGAP